MAEAALQVVGIDALPRVAWSWMTEATRRGHRITLVNGARGRCYNVSLVATGTWPVGQGGVPARPAECTAHPSAHAVRTVSVAKTAVAHSRPEPSSPAMVRRSAEATVEKES